MQEEPKEFNDLCQKVGLALMMGQKLQFSLAYYYSVFHKVHSNWNNEKVKEKIKFHLSKPMGVVINSIESDAPLESDLFQEIKDFKKQRNWLAHDFDEESTPFLTQGEKFEHYMTVMDNITIQAHNIMQRLNEIGEDLIPIKSK